MNDPTNALERIFRKLQMMLGVARVQTVNDSGLSQMLQIQFSTKEIRDNTIRVSDYGFTSNPKPGCQTIFLCVAGDRSNGVVIGTNDESARKKNLQPGEVAIYDDLGQSVYLTRTGIVVEGAGLPITVNGNTTINGTLHVTGAVTGDMTITAPNVNGTTNVTFGGKSGVGHTHSGVSTGTSNTGAPV